MAKLNTYTYCGPVMEFGKLICERWCGETRAPSAKKALSNLAYQFKQEYDRVPRSRISLPGVVTLINEEG